MRYLLSRIRSDREERIYRNYVTDSLYYQGQNKALQERYIDVLRRKPKETKKADEIISEVTAKLGLQVV